MLNAIKRLGILAGVMSLVACGTYNPNGYTNYQTYTDHGMDLYPEGYENTGNLTDRPPSSQKVSVPESYHVSAYHAPTKSGDLDEQWVSGQNASSYTIEVANGESASSVANTLLKVPKTERMAEIKVPKGDKTLYKGVYGSYPTQDAAEQARQALPADVKANATVKTWGSVQ